jgi:2-keto-4-pentenoate hydratase/2-oxohepta-3-ene-1,7-dioic acid hydratase in catechol pathway
LKFIKFTKNGIEKTGVLEDNQIIELECSIIEAINSFNTSEFQNKGTYDIENVKIKPPVLPSKIICVGLNYIDHAKELQMDIPDEPIIFIKPSTSVIGHLDNIIYPKSSNQVDYEVELGIVISKEAFNVKEKDSDEFVGGYTILNDVTARDIQKKDIQWTRAKSFNTFAPIGPWIDTDLDPTKQKISLKLNGKLKQNSNTKNMIFGVTELIEFVSNIMTLKPGDVIATGTPPGVGSMDIGDTVQAQIKDIGTLENNVTGQK